MYNAAVIGGANGIGLAIVSNLICDNDCEIVHIFDIVEPSLKNDKIAYHYLDMRYIDFSCFCGIANIQKLYITCGIGRLSKFETFTDVEIDKTININLTSVIRIIKHFYDRIKGENDFYTSIMVSIAGHIVSPLFAIYSASKAGLSKFIQAVNCELKNDGCKNRILEVSPGSLKGTKFAGGDNNVQLNCELVNEINKKMLSRDQLFIPSYDEIFKRVIDRNNANYENFADESYQYKLKTSQVNNTPKIVIGYLSGTFDLFHIGHLNLLRRAKKECDYLIVGIHKDASHKGKTTVIPFEDRKAVVESCRYVDKVIESMPEDCDVWSVYHYNKLFVGSDYKGTERFLRYENFFKDKNCTIVYFPYTVTVSSTELREKLKH